MNDKLNHIKTQVDRLAKVINAPDNLLPTYGNSKDAHPNIEINDTGFLSYEIYERGQQLKMEYAHDTDHLLYVIFRDVTSMMALDYSSKHPNPNIDSRRIQFDYQLELLGKLNKDWQQKEKQTQDAIAMQFPFDDYEGKRQTYLRELLGNGFLYNEALEKVKAKFP